MATREQLAVVLDSARGWTAVPMTLTGCYDTNHLFYAFHSVHTEYTRECVNKPSGYALGCINTFPRVFCIRTWKA